MSFGWSPTFDLNLQLQKYDFYSKFRTLCLRKQLGFYRKESEHAKIVLRCPKSEHDVTLKSPLNQTLLANRSTMDSNRSTIFTDSKSLQNAVKSDYDAENRSTISCFLKHFK